jgi:hypothetical protein
MAKHRHDGFNNILSSDQLAFPACSGHCGAINSNIAFAFLARAGPQIPLAITEFQAQVDAAMGSNQSLQAGSIQRSSENRCYNPSCIR